MRLINETRNPDKNGNPNERLRIMSRIVHYFRKAISKAEEIYENSEEINGMERCTMRLIFSSNQLLSLISTIKDMLGMIRDTIQGSYSHCSKKAILKALAAIIYLLWPIDAIPDCIPVAGLADDAVVITYVLSQIDYELQRYRCWVRSIGSKDRKRG